MRSRLDAYARQRLTPEDFVPLLEYDAEISLEDDHPGLLAGAAKAGAVWLRQSGAGVRGARCQAGAAARVLKEKHMKLRVVPGEKDESGRFQRAQEVLGWRMMERIAQDPLMAGDRLDLAFTLDYNSHPDFGGVQLNLVDYTRSVMTPTAVAAAQR